MPTKQATQVLAIAERCNAEDKAVLTEVAEQLLQGRSSCWTVLGDLVSLIPAGIALLLITNSWDQEWLVVACLLLGVGGKAALEKFKGASVT